VAFSRVALTILAGLSVGACSLVTSLSDLEGTGLDAGPSGGGDGTDLESATTDDTGTDSEPDAGDPGDSTVPPDTDSGAASDSTVPPGPDGGTPLDSGASSDADGAPPIDAPVEAAPACTADVRTDPLNCGLCGHYCQGGACRSGACQPFAIAITSGSVGIAIDATFVYWADADAGAIDKISKSLTRVGTATPVVTGTAAQNVQGIAADGTFVYWTNKMASGQVHRALPTGAALTTIATKQGQPDWIATNGTTVVWSNQTGNQIMSVPANSDGAVTPKQLNVSGENGTTPAGVAIDGTSAYYASKISGGGLAEIVSLAGGAVRELGTATYVGMAVDNVNAYWTGGSANPSVYQNGKTSTPATEMAIATGALVCPLAVASDGTNVYFVDQGTTSCAPPGNDAGAVYRVPVGHTGALPPPMAGGLVDPQGIAVDSTSIYWVTGGTVGAVMKLAK
jgi:hypothetical protein